MDIVEDLRGFEEFAEYDIQVTRLLVLELLKVPREDAEHRALHRFFYYVIVWLCIKFVFNGSEEFVDLRADILLRLHLLLGRTHSQLLLSLALQCAWV